MTITTNDQYVPTEARLRERVKGSLGEYAYEFGIDGEAAMDEWIDQALAERDNRVRADERAKRPDRIEELEKNLSYEVEQKIKLADTLRDERAKRPDREQIASALYDYEVEVTNHGDCCYPWSYVSEAVRERYLGRADAVLALEPETDQELQDRIEVLEKNLAYEVAQKIKLAEQLQAATTTSLTLEQARWKMHAGIDSRCSEEVAAKAKPVIDLVLSSLALEPEARELTDTNNQGE